MKYRVVLLADHRWRDLPGLVAVKVHLEKLDPELDCRVVDIHLLEQSVELFRPHLVVVNHLHEPDRNKIFDTVRRRGGLIAVAITEGRGNNTALMEWTARGWPIRLCDLFLAWSEEFAQYLPSEVNRIVTGCPRLDYHYAPLKALVNNRERSCAMYGLDPDKPIVTVASSFPQAKFANYGADFLLRDWERLGKTKIKGYEDPAHLAKSEMDAFLRFQGWLIALKRETGLQILVKPHPGEDVRFWQHFCDETGIRLMLGDYIFNLFAVSDVHVARVDCTTIPEAWMVGIPTVQCDLGEVGIDGAGAEAKELGEAVSSIGDFIKSCLGFLNDLSAEEVVGHTQAYCSKWMGPRDASRKVAQALFGLLNERQPKTHIEPTWEDLVKFHKTLQEHSNRNVLPSVDYLGQYSKATTQSAVDEWVMRIQDILFPPGE